MIKKPKIDPSMFLSNPLINTDFKVEVIRFSDKGSFRTDGDIHVPNVLELEKESITKVYTKMEHRLFMSRLSVGAKSLFLWLIYEVDSGEDYLWINKVRYMSETGIRSVNTYKTAVDELSRNLFIYPSLVRDVYWINPRLFFCGSRVKKYKGHVVVYRTKRNG